MDQAVSDEMVNDRKGTDGQRPTEGHRGEARPTDRRSGICLQYQVALPQPASHLFEVTLQITGWQQARLDLKMPVWTPGSYLVREYARHLQDFSATGASTTAEAQPLTWKKLSKNHWQITPGPEPSDVITIRYRIFANELTVRTNHLDSSHGYFNGAALFCFIPGHQHQDIQVTIAPPPQWQVVTALPEIAQNTFLAADFDALVDSPFEIGNPAIYDFEVGGKPHRYAIWGGSQSNGNMAALVTDTQKIIAVEAALFGGLPYERYLFLLHLSGNGFGGLEHRDSCSLLYKRLGFHPREQYERFLQLVAHEFFHLWNVKRIRPKGLEVFDYEGENYTASLWFSEGTTSYYDALIPLRAGIYSPKTYLKYLSQSITRYLTTPGRLIQPLSDSSFDTWIKLYRPDANSANSQISYYLKGEMVTLLLDLAIRIRHPSGQSSSKSPEQSPEQSPGQSIGQSSNPGRSFDDVMRLMWKQFGKPEVGFTPEQLQDTIESVAGFDLTAFFARYLDGTEEIAFDEYLIGMGLCLTSNADEGNLPPFLGISLKSEGGGANVRFVEAGSPAQLAGLDAGDELLAIDGLRVTAAGLADRLQAYPVGATVDLTFFHLDQLQQAAAVLEAPRPTQYYVVPLETPSAQQQQNFRSWLGVSISDAR